LKQNLILYKCYTIILIKIHIFIKYFLLKITDDLKLEQKNFKSGE